MPFAKFLGLFSNGNHDLRNCCDLNPTVARVSHDLSGRTSASVRHKPTSKSYCQSKKRLETRSWVSLRLEHINALRPLTQAASTEIHGQAAPLNRFLQLLELQQMNTRAADNGTAAVYEKDGAPKVLEARARVVHARELVKSTLEFVWNVLLFITVTALGRHNIEQSQVKFKTAKYNRMGYRTGHMFDTAVIQQSVGMIQQDESGKRCENSQGQARRADKVLQDKSIS
ncbi:hypothetical protein C8F04DRAFT_1243702 [Mycena alexandri]|uniref:Uncharacterized protein n=1 Tax=Mycena alexandri TaxID=1745969 RepID=A0AAD6WL02_9AGAR|nr:hypothetical protein C8F04DRAFT_1243702 [Mycena alexandri]